MYCYGGNNPVRYVDPIGQFIANQFVWAAVQTFGGIVELSAGFIEVFFINAKATKGLPLISKGKASSAIIKATKAIDKISINARIIKVKYEEGRL